MDQSKGRTAFIAFQEPAWHGLGTVVNTAISAQDALEKGGLDFHVEKSPNVHRIIKDEKLIQEIVSETSFFTYRTDTNAVLGSRLGPDYTVWQNAQALAIVDELLKEGKLSIETAGAVDEGRRVFICMKFVEPIKVGGKDEVFQYLLIANGHDGTLAIAPLTTNVRVVCNNTLGAALAGAEGMPRIRHTINANDRVKDALKIMGILESNSKHNAAAYEAMKAAKLTQQAFFDYIGNIFIDQEDIAELQRGNKEAISTKTKNTMSEVLQFAETGVGQREALGNGGLNMWYAYNAVTGYLTGKGYKSADNRFNSLILGESAKKITQAGELALAPDNIRPLRATPGSGLILN
jgi:phage/plasmid-like protein (TIGR03299 family)